MLNQNKRKKDTVKANYAEYHREYRRKNPDKQKLYTLRRAAKLLAVTIGCTFTYNEDGAPIAVKPKDGDSIEQ